MIIRIETAPKKESGTNDAPQNPGVTPATETTRKDEQTNDKK